MPFAVNEFVSNLRLDGARTNYFQVEVTNPIASGADNILPFLCRSAGIPESEINVIQLPYMGRTLHFAGVRPQFQPWTIQVINDEDFAIRNALETWHNYINSMRGNLRRFPTASPQEYKSVAKVYQMSKLGDVIRTYQFYGMFPSSIAPIQLDYGNDGIEEFQVTFVYDWWEIVEGTTGNAGGAA